MSPSLRLTGLSAACLTLALGCAPAPQCPSPPAVSAPDKETPAPTTAPTTAPAELKGAFALTTAKTKDQTVDLGAVARTSGAGEVLIGFSEEGVTISAWQLTHNTSEKAPDHTVYALCRGRATFTPAWRGNTMTLPTKIAVKGFSDALDEQVRREGDKTTRTRMTSVGGCGFSLDAGDYAVEIVSSDAEGPSKIRIVNREATFELERSTAVDKLDVKSVVERLNAK